MKTKNFFVVSLVVIVVVAVVTSLVSILLLQQPVLPAYGTGEQGQVQLGTLGAVTNVIIVDETITSKCVSTNCIKDIVTFSNVVRGTVYNTEIPIKGNPTPGPMPFLIQNEGSEAADVSVYSDVTPLFSSANSYVKFSIHNTMLDLSSYADPWGTKMDNCWDIPTSTNRCWTSTPCGTSVGGCVLPYGQSNAVLAIHALKATDQTDEAVMHIEIKAATDEPTGTKSTVVVIKGVAV